MKKKVLGALLVAAMTMSMFAGCGSSTDNKESNDVKNDGTQAAAGDDAEADETLTVWAWDPNFNIYALQQAEKIYQKDHPNLSWIFRKRYIQISRQL